MKNYNKAFSEAASEIHDNANGLNYKRVGNYYLPMLTAPKSPKRKPFTTRPKPPVREKFPRKLFR